MVAYISKKNAAYQKLYVLPADIDPEKLWLLEEGHCFRSQIVNLCELRRQTKEGSHFEYEAGSLETLRRMVEINDGVTILPELATFDLDEEQQKSVRHFTAPRPVREVSMITHRDFVKKRLVEALKTAILVSIPQKVKNNLKERLIPL